MITKLPKPSIGQYRFLVLVEAPGSLVPDGDGGWIETWEPLAPPTWKVGIRPATSRDAERAAAGTIVTHQSHVIRGRFHPQVTTETRITDHEGHVYQVTSVNNLDHMNTELELIADRLVL